MKKLLILLFIFILFGNCIYAQKSKIRSSRGGKNRMTSGFTKKVSSRGANSISSDEKVNDFETCMDNICKSDMANDKGRCRCSSQLVRIEKIIRDIEKIQNEADEKNKYLETLMNVSNTGLVDDTVGNIYENINSIEKKSKKIASQKLDSKYLVAEGYPLYETALKECKSHLPSDKGELEKTKQQYDILIEEDCASYTSILKEKADTASNLLIQAQKNQEMFQEQEYKKLNQLDVKSCYVEYEACLKTQCGENFSFCFESSKLSANLKKCEAINYGKCEENKSVVFVDLKKAIAKEKAKEEVKQSCISSMGQIVNGKCLFRVLYVADKCTTAKTCGESQEKMMNPGSTVVCDDVRGNFKDLVLGCKESCYLVASNNEEKKIGTNVESNGGKNVGRVIGAIFSSGLSLISSNAQPGCKANKDLDRYVLPVPAGWGKDGYPINNELKKAF